MDSLWKDVRHAIHSLRANPGFALVSILTLALGIGATTAIFSVVNGVLLRPLPLHEPDRLVMVWEHQLTQDVDQNPTNPVNYGAWSKEKGIFSSIGAFLDWEMSVTGYGEPELIKAGLVTSSVLPALGVKPYLGRVIEGDGYAEAAEGNVVLSHAFWRRKFSGDPKAVGTKIQVGANTYTIVGVMPREFFIPTSEADLFLPFVVPETGGRYLRVIARLAPGVSAQQAQARMDVVAARLRQEYPERNTNFGVNVLPVHEQVVGDIRRALLIVMAAVGCLLLIGCVNIANLLLSRATARTREMATRGALGASRGQLIRQLLTESVVLAIIGGILGVIVAGWATMLLVRLTPEAAMLPRTAEIAVDGRVLAVTAGVTLLTGIIFGLAPALHASRVDLQTGLKSSGRGSSQDRSRKLLRNGLVVAEVALATVLLIGAGLLVKSFAKLQGVETGVRRDGVLTMRIILPAAYSEPERRQMLIGQILERLGQIPGVERVAATVGLPFTGWLNGNDYVVEGEPPIPEGERPSAEFRSIAGDYFAALGVPILRGRAFDPRDTGKGPTQVLVNEAFARRHFRDGEAIGRRLSYEWFTEINAEIVGVVGNVRSRGLDQEEAPAIYQSYVYNPGSQFTLIVASSGDPRNLQNPVTRVLRALDPSIPVDQVKTLDEVISDSISRPQFNAAMVSIFAVLGLLLASIGIYGVLSYTVSQRQQEMGIRMALGARPEAVLRMVVRDGMAVALSGVAVGVVIAVAATRLLGALLYGVEPWDPAVFLTVVATLTAVALGASYLPARRATRVDPMIALRTE